MKLKQLIDTLKELPDDVLNSNVLVNGKLIEGFSVTKHYDLAGKLKITNVSLTNYYNGDE